MDAVRAFGDFDAVAPMLPEEPTWLYTYQSMRSWLDFMLSLPSFEKLVDASATTCGTVACGRN